MTDHRTDTPEDRDTQTVLLLKRRNTDGLCQLLRDHGGRVKWCLRKEFRATLDEVEIDEALNQAAYHAWRALRANKQSKIRKQMRARC